MFGEGVAPLTLSRPDDGALQLKANIIPEADL